MYCRYQTDVTVIAMDMSIGGIGSRRIAWCVQCDLKSHYIASELLRSSPSFSSHSIIVTGWPTDNHIRFPCSKDGQYQFHDGFVGETDN